MVPPKLLGVMVISMVCWDLRLEKLGLIRVLPGMISTQSVCWVLLLMVKARLVELLVV